MLPLLLAPLLLDLSGQAEDAFLVADWTIWAIFALELGVKTYRAPARAAYLRRHWFDVLIVVLPFLRPLRIVRSARAVRGLRAVRLAPFLARTVHSTRAILAEHGLQYVLLVGVVPHFIAMDVIAAHCDGYSPMCSSTRRTARSRTSTGYLPRSCHCSILSQLGASTFSRGGSRMV